MKNHVTIIFAFLFTVSASSSDVQVVLDNKEKLTIQVNENKITIKVANGREAEHVWTCPAFYNGVCGDPVKGEAVKPFNRIIAAAKTQEGYAAVVPVVFSGVYWLKTKGDFGIDIAFLGEVWSDNFPPTVKITGEGEFIVTKPGPEKAILKKTFVWKELPAERLAAIRKMESGYYKGAVDLDPVTKRDWLDANRYLSLIEDREIQNDIQHGLIYLNGVRYMRGGVISGDRVSVLDNRWAKE
jgi:hypothetical protein